MRTSRKRVDDSFSDRPSLVCRPRRSRGGLDHQRQIHPRRRAQAQGALELASVLGRGRDSGCVSGKGARLDPELLGEEDDERLGERR